MAQIVKLKRTAVTGRIPTTSNLELGELAMNTYDGRIFFEKSGSSESIQEILTTNSHPYAVTGSLYLNGAVTASYFKGDGSQLTNLPSTVGIEEATTITASFAGVDDITVTHNFDTYNVLVQVFDNSRNLIIPSNVSLPTLNTARVTLSSTGAGHVVVAKAGHLISGSLTADDASLLNGQNGAYYLNWTNFNNIPSGIVSGSTQIDFDSVSSNPFTESVATYITASGHIVPSSHETYDLGSSNHRWRDLYLSGSTIDLGGTKISRDTDGNVQLADSGGTLKTLKVAELEIGSGAKRVKLKIDDNNKVKFEDKTSGDSEAPTFYKETVSGATSFNIDHNLDEEYPIVQAYNNSKFQVIPASVFSSSANRTQVRFSTTFSGTIVVKK